MEGFSLSDMVKAGKEKRRGQGSDRRRHGHATEAWCGSRLGEGWHDCAWRHKEVVLKF